MSTVPAEDATARIRELAASCEAMGVRMDVALELGRLRSLIDGAAARIRHFMPDLEEVHPAAAGAIAAELDDLTTRADLTPFIDAELARRSRT